MCPYFLGDFQNSVKVKNNLFMDIFKADELCVICYIYL